MKNYFILLLLFVCAFVCVKAQHEWINQGHVAVWEGGAEDVFYTETDFNNHNFGVLSSASSLYLKSGQLTVSKDAEGDIVDADMYYRVYKTSETPGEFFNVNLPWQSEWTDLGLTFQMWWNDSPDETDLNLLQGLDDGEYTIEVYFQAENAESTILYLNNATQNYKAYFTLSTATAIPKSRGANSSFFSVYPNPVDDELKIRLNSAQNINSISIVDNQSSIIFKTGKTRGNPNQSINIPVEELSPGTYFVRIQTEQGVEVQRIIISK